MDQGMSCNDDGAGNDCTGLDVGTIFQDYFPLFACIQDYASVNLTLLPNAAVAIYHNARREQCGGRHTGPRRNKHVVRHGTSHFCS